MSKKPVAFMSYVNLDDEFGRLSKFRELLSAEVRMQLGEEFPIFQDRNDILWGQNWKERIDESLDAATFLIPILTPSFFKSSYCRGELERFLEREKKLKRNDLILPIYYVTCPVLEDEAKRKGDELAKVIASRQVADWRELRHELHTPANFTKALDGLARQIIAALERAPKPSRPRKSRTATPGTAKKGASPSPSQPSDVTQGEGKGKAKAVRKVEPPTVVVDQLHRGDYATISEAITQATPGTKILVRPGYYQETLTIDKPLELIGEGEQGDVVIQANAQNTILFKTTLGRISNLTLRNVSSGKFFCVLIAQGRLDLEDCDISSQSLSGVAISGGADPRLRRNRIHDSKQSGVLVYDDSRGTLEDNDIFANTFAGVSIKTGGDPTLRRNRIHDGKAAGVLIFENGRGTLEDNDIFANAFAGVEIRDGGDPTLRRNRIYGNMQIGVRIKETGQATLEDNDIFAHVFAGVEIQTQSNPILRRNKIHDGKSAGVLFVNNGRGTLEDNDIFANAFAGVEIRDGGDPTLRRNKVHDNTQSGAFINANGRGTMEDNDIFANGLAGVEIKTGGAPTLRHNRITGNKTVAIKVFEDGGGTIENNNLSGNNEGAWAIAAESDPNLKRTRNTE